MQRAPVCAATLLVASIIATWRVASPASAAMSARSASGAVLPARIELQAERSVRWQAHRLRGDGADAGLGPGHGGADGEVVGLHGDAECAGRGVAGDDGVGHDAAPCGAALGGVICSLSCQRRSAVSSSYVAGDDGIAFLLAKYLPDTPSISGEAAR